MLTWELCRFFNQKVDKLSFGGCALFTTAFNSGMQPQIWIIFQLQLQITCISDIHWLSQFDCSLFSWHTEMNQWNLQICSSACLMLSSMEMCLQLHLLKNYSKSSHETLSQYFSLQELSLNGKDQPHPTMKGNHTHWYVKHYMVHPSYLEEFSWFLCLMFVFILVLECTFNVTF